MRTVILMTENLSQKIERFNEHLLYTFGTVDPNGDFYGMLKSAILNTKESDFQSRGYDLPLDFYVGIVTGMSIGRLQSISMEGKTFEKKLMSIYSNYQLPQPNLRGEITSMFYEGLAKGIIWGIYDENKGFISDIFSRLINSVTTPYDISNVADIKLPHYIQPRGKPPNLDDLSDYEKVWPLEDSGITDYRDNPLAV